VADPRELVNALDATYRALERRAPKGVAMSESEFARKVRQMFEAIAHRTDATADQLREMALAGAALVADVAADDDPVPCPACGSIAGPTSSPLHPRQCRACGADWPSEEEEEEEEYSCGTTGCFHDSRESAEACMTRQFHAGTGRLDDDDAAENARVERLVAEYKRYLQAHRREEE
jgi:hypothetical protein